MGNKLSHLSKDDISKLILEYYNGVNVNSLILKYKVDVSNNRLYKTFPKIETGDMCIHCDSKLVSVYNSRSCLSRFDISCPNCGHHNSGYCPCDNCNKERVKQEELKLQGIRDKLIPQLNADKDMQPYNSLNTKDRVLLGAFLRGGISEDLTHIKSLNELTEKLSPTHDMDLTVVRYLIKRGLISVSAKSSFDCFSNVTDNSFTYDLTKVKWDLNVIDFLISKGKMIDNLMNPSVEFDNGELQELWTLLNTEEVVSYLKYSIKNVFNIDYKIGAKTNTIVNDLINRFSISEIYGFIYRSTNNALRFYTENNVNKSHAANTIIGNIQKFAERVEANNWEVNKFSRDSRCPESVLSSFMYGRVLKIGDAGFNEPIKKLISNGH